MSSEHFSVLFVCLGNIIRSPTCEGLLRTLVKPSVTVDSAAVTRDDLGQHPHREVQRLAKEHGYNISNHVSRLITQQDYQKFDLIVALEPYVFSCLKRKAPSNSKAKLCEFAPGVAIANPWCGDRDDFVEMYQEIEEWMPKFIEANIPQSFLK